MSAELNDAVVRRFVYREKDRAAEMLVELLGDAALVAGNWETGDLATAVNVLREAAEELADEIRTKGAPSR